MTKNRFAKAFDRLTGALNASRAKMEDDYLNRSVSIYDLERRMKEIERGRFRDF